MSEGQLGMYSTLSRLPFPRSYIGKIMLVAFLGTHVPLIALLLYFVRSARLTGAAELRIVMVILVATLLGTALTLLVLRSVLRPVSLASDALTLYLDASKLPSLPVHFKDTVGRLMANVQYSLEQLHEVIGSLERVSATDYLTGVHNRRAAELQLRQDLARAARSSDSMWVVAFDVDDFKLINDSYGHHAGDACLKHVAEIAAGCIRRGDWLARWGGDEFVLGLWHAGDSTPSEVLERIRGRLRDIALRLPDGHEAHLTVSMGAAPYRPGDDVETLIQHADNALYEAKRGGKNRLVYSPERSHAR